MKRSKKAMLAAGMLAGVCMLTGCASGGSAQPTPSPDVAQQQSAEPSPEASEEPAEEAPLSLTVDGKAVEPAAMEENGRLMLPLVETGEALGWTAKSEALSEETQTRRSVALTKDDSRITVTWLVSDNTASAITWQKDGLLIPVDTRLTTLGDVVYVPAAFFEEAVGARVARKDGAVEVLPPESAATPETQPQTATERSGMKIEASKRTHVSAQKALTAAVETAIIIPEISEGDSRIRCPGVCASRLYFLLHFHNRSFESVRGCHAPVLGRQGTAEMRRRAPTYRERWVKNDDSGTLGFFSEKQRRPMMGCVFSIRI